VAAFCILARKEVAVPKELDAAVAENLVSSAMGFLPLTPGEKMLCTKRQLRECLLTLAQEAYAMGFLAGQKEQFLSHVVAGAAERPAWMDISLDAPNSLASYGIRPVVIRSLIGAGYRQLGDLCWVSDYQLRKLFYIGRVTTRKIRTVIRRFQTGSP